MRKLLRRRLLPQLPERQPVVRLVENETINPEQLYGRYQMAEDEVLADRKRKNKFFHRAAAKALNMIPEMEDDDMHLNVSNRSGFGWKEMAVIAATCLGGFYLWNDKEVVIPTVPTTPPAVTVPMDQEYDVRFYDAEGNLIDIPQIKPNPVGSG